MMTDIYTIAPILLLSIVAIVAVWDWGEIELDLQAKKINIKRRYSGYLPTNNLDSLTEKSDQRQLPKE
ncbi:hypothetical protein [Chamaesiphon minutus]|uniref:Uncharacterized protein n=1 Tax=Chamaesiphon minutus (strain ATCC 27169 / PCC 6605) TaxID=1173020 RepID=K9UAG7_CHAP6|nr:hypothetical protein [Chamaesiphon minutus]AFY91805.1 hypothetical protein Cha6605_0518 [Chamaesiphon minutus PCC 6605]